MKIYLAARYTRREELLRYREDLVEIGHEVTSRWLDGNHHWDSSKQALADQLEWGTVAPEASVFAIEDVEDILAASRLVSFTEPSRAVGATRGGRHVEFGYGLAQRMTMLVVGHRENVFHALPIVQFFPTWPEAREYLRGMP